tara:strand:+ start:6992 stop:7279 length:288 start_codon:yes stop_codon:yes gene_type:complete
MHTVKWNKKDWEILDISFSDKRKLHMLNSMCFIDNKINQENYYKLLEAVRDLAGYGDGTEKQKLLEDITMVEVDTLMQTILIEYLGLNVKKTSGN